MLLLMSIGMFAQGLKGTVYNQENSTLEGAHVYHVLSKTYVHTDHHGEFHLDHVHTGDTIVVSYIGYITQKIAMSNLSEKLQIILNPEPTFIDEITITPALNGLNFNLVVNNKTTPVRNAQEVLSSVPGLFIGQHAGGGKAEQIFLRGFDVDHGTDIALSVDGMPVNMVSHAHGQGYADLHFLIPETIERIEYGKGPYKADKGNFATAGDVEIKTKDRLENSLIRIEGGQFNTSRMLGLFQVVDNQHHSFYTGADFLFTDGPFVSPQNFSRVNYIAKYSGRLKNHDKINVGFTYFTSTWDASGQIPTRAVEQGLITRFGAIDDTEGGTTSRLNFVLSHNKQVDENTVIESSVYYSRYKFELFSNFTFFLEDSINGDQIKQKEDRNLFGAKSTYIKRFNIGAHKSVFKAGVEARNDQSFANQLLHTTRRRFVRDTVQIGDINETNLAAFASLSTAVGKWLFNPALRVDYFSFQYNDYQTATYATQNDVQAIVSPKLNVFYNASENLQFYSKVGRGFHSNDTRGAVADSGLVGLTPALGADLGVIWKLNDKILIHPALWYLYLEQEFVYVGDAGIVEPSGKTVRKGIDLSLRYQPAKWLTWTIDANYAHARSIDDPEGENYIPLAPNLTLMSTLTIVHKSGLYGSLRLRHMNDRPANEDNSIVAIGYSILDFNIGYTWKKMDFNIQIQNLLDSEWNETQFATESRLQKEPAPVTEINYTPGTPFFVKAGMAFNF